MMLGVSMSTFTLVRGRCWLAILNISLGSCGLTDVIFLAAVASAQSEPSFIVSRLIVMTTSVC